MRHQQFHSHDKIERLRREAEKAGAVVLRSSSGRQLGKHYGRPNVNFGDVVCKQCGKPCDFEESCAHNAANPARSRLYIRATCHGATCDIFMTFQQWGDNEGKKIVAFDDWSIEEPPCPAFIIPKLPLMLMDRRPDSAG